MRIPCPRHLLSMACLLAVTGAHGTGTATREELIERVRANWQTLEDARAQLSALQHAGGATSGGIADYQAWIDELRFSLGQDCRQLGGMAGIALPADLPCDSGSLPSAGAAFIDTGDERTREEGTAQLDDRLRRSLGEFDDRLLREQERVKAQKTAGTAAGGSGAGAGSGSATGDAGEAGGAAGAEGAWQEAGDRTGTRATGSGSPGRGGTSSAPPGTPDGSDDDVVARQLREAAEKETDPELKKKLWEEYRRYKQGIR